MSNQAELDEPTNQHHVAFWQLQDLEEAIADAAPEELPELHSKLVALSTGLTQAILDWHNKQVDYVIGEKDESDITVLRKYLPEDEARHTRDQNYARNFLRAEQRQRAERNKLMEANQ